MSLTYPAVGKAKTSKESTIVCWSQIKVQYVLQNENKLSRKSVSHVPYYANQKKTLKCRRASPIMTSQSVFVLSNGTNSQLLTLNSNIHKWTLLSSDHATICLFSCVLNLFLQFCCSLPQVHFRGYIAITEHWNPPTTQHFSFCVHTVVAITAVIIKLFNSTTVDILYHHPAMTSSKVDIKTAFKVIPNAITSCKFSSKTRTLPLSDMWWLWTTRSCTLNKDLCKAHYYANHASERWIFH